ncbi:MAG: multifunctional CCA addition/repair protein [Cellvibrio sp.]|nr:multifunctional CCA addition/repair protein [Cellvibrio sp.]
MQIFLVGGAVRDQLLNRPVTERDWVVVGASIDEMLAQGFQQVGKDFPVFLHPKSKEEYALARTERKSGKGYTGFAVNADSSITLEEDLSRRDLTINAIAQDDEGNLTDPFNGQADINNKLLRHVSPAFAEDPLRVLRVARFAARYAHLGFRVADETLVLMREMVSAGEVNYLTPERVWKETQRALTEKNPEVYFSVLRECGALKVLFSEIDALFGVPQTAAYHPEIDTGVHCLMSLQQAVKLSDDPLIRFATLIHDLGKATTPKDILPRHIGHEERSVPLIEILCQRIKCPNDYKELSLAVAAWHTHCHRALELKASSVLKLFLRLDAFRRPERFAQFLICCEADARGRTGFEDRDYPQANFLHNAYQVCLDVKAKEFVERGISGIKINEAMHKKRIVLLREFKKANV